MPKLSIAVNHALDQGEVIQRLKNESNLLQSSFGNQVQDFHEDWSDKGLTFRFKAMGMSVDGSVAVEPNQILTTANVPLAAMMFKGMIEAKVKSRLEELLEKK